MNNFYKTVLAVFAVVFFLFGLWLTYRTKSLPVVGAYAYGVALYLLVLALVKEITWEGAFGFWIISFLVVGLLVDLHALWGMVIPLVAIVILMGVLPEFRRSILSGASVCSDCGENHDV